MIIRRYISKEILKNFLSLLAILSFIAICNQFVSYLAKVAAGKMPLAILFKLLLFYLPQIFALLGPIAFFIAVLASFGRLYSDSEAAVLFSCGYDWRACLRQIMALALILASLLAVVTLVINPICNKAREELLANSQIQGVLQAVTPGRFQTIDDGDHLVFYLEDIASDGTVSNIFIAQQPKLTLPNQQNQVVVLTAETASIQQQADNLFYLVLRNGYRYTGTPGHADYTVTSFAEYGRELRHSPMPIMNTEGASPSLELAHSSRLQDIAELQWRFAMPIAVLVLAVFALPLSEVAPRQGRFAKFLPALVVFLSYYNLLMVTKRLVVSGSIKPVFGLWMVHAIYILIAVILIFAKMGGFARITNKQVRT